MDSQAQIQDGQKSDAQIDLRGTPCPINFVRTKLYLEKMMPGEILEVWLDSGEPIEQVPDSLIVEGYKIEEIKEKCEYFVLKVRRPEMVA
ncbi:SirA-like [Trichodesmium erythraeum IMS101]|jgi:Predicted redox protein, regulator of disulfide bond formation|uniref:SirA-like n=1 Tax=Trichodesmium erythraeum (strain IMS101) TaxID=203124 RepID=Q114R2_TRIEI|nr:sulfurtransferase TusA family protein [Trichodesmium erythraeum GBRTRLIN201]MCH2048939.1 sulfurtransferase TusA family protein [Trichodesmium sp. ALOHA_ZT_67]MCL2927762.1 sulfurtransferase TusA family protein [Trichodesmium sp. MAG_R01]MDE5069012.1 sulfurtransferase TusA family protein [Trichodesmium sp. St4_bin8_1]MDE5073326.1 sulfurtransferase TusA family protein [Trichodesmium sp. St5_bin8]MDE5091895.1 sulfurtransferase TusA family protein [Trichodesmium sp. St18_bin3_1_1]MDE5095531.1 s